MRYHTPFETHTLPTNYAGCDVEIVQHASHNLRNGWRRCVIEVPQGDIAYAPGSTKRAVVGPCFMVYEMTNLSTEGYEFTDATEFYNKLFESRAKAQFTGSHAGG